MASEHPTPLEINHGTSFRFRFSLSQIPICFPILDFWEAVA